MELAERIIHAVRAHPGLTVYRLAILLAVEERELDRVLTVLGREERLSGRVQRTSIRWYTPETPLGQEPPTSKIRPGMRAWEALVLAREHKEGVTPAEIAASTPMTKGYAYKMMLSLQDARLVRRCRNERRWVVNQKGRDLLAREQPGAG